MNINKFTQRSQEATTTMGKLVSQNGDQWIDEEHLLSALPTVSDSLTASLTAGMEIQREAFLGEDEILIQKLPKVSSNGREYMSAGLSHASDGAEGEAKAMGDDYASIEHLFSDLLKNPDHALKELFQTYGITREKSLQALSTVRSNQRVTSDSPGTVYNILNKYGYNFAEHAQDQKFDPVIGRDEEIRNAVRILSRRAKNNPVPISEPSTSKTAIAEGLAQRIVYGSVPEGLKDKWLFTPDMGTLVAGAEYRNGFEEKLKAVLGEVKKSGGRVMLSIDELRAIVDTGASEGGMDADSTLKPTFTHGRLHCIGTTTLDEYRKYIGEDPTLERRFQLIFVGQPTIKDTISIPCGLRERYKNYHHVKIQDGALVNATVLPDHYITDRFLPGKAVDLVDEACAMIKVELDSLPAEPGEVDRRRIQLEIEVTTLWKKTDDLSRERLGTIKKKLVEKRAAFAEAEAR